MLEVKKLHKAYKNNSGIFEINFTIEENGLYAVIGANGAGKTTTFKALDNLITYQGEIIYQGKNLKKETTKYVSAAIEEPSFYKELTCLENLLLFSELSKDEFFEQGKEIIKKFELETFWHNQFSTCSLGMKQKIHIACALITPAPIILLDEPFVGLDPKAAQKLRYFIRDLAKEKIILYATHVFYDIDREAKKVLFFEKGKLKRIYTPKSAENYKVYKILVEDMTKLDYKWLADYTFNIDSNGITVIFNSADDLYTLHNLLKKFSQENLIITKVDRVFNQLEYEFFSKGEQ